MTEVSVPPAAERDIEHLLRNGKSAQWVATNLGEPMPLVMKVLDRLRKEAAEPVDDDEDDETPAAPVAGARPLASVPTPPTTPGSAPSVDALASAAARSESKRTQTLGVKLAGLAADVRQRLTDEREAAEKAEKQRQEREAATAEIARLEEQLRVAREKARVRPVRRSRGGSGMQRESKPLSDAQRRQMDAMRAANKNTDPCANGCGYVAKTKAGKKSHEQGSKCPGGDAA